VKHLVRKLATNTATWGHTAGINLRNRKETFHSDRNSSLQELWTCGMTWMALSQWTLSQLPRGS